MTSAKQLAANLENAQHSTGPRTPNSAASRTTAPIGTSPRTNSKPPKPCAPNQPDLSPLRTPAQ